MQLTQQTFYRKFGVRVLPQVMTPAMNELKLLAFPKESVYHYLPFDGLSDGPANDDPLLRDYKRSIPILSPIHLTSFEGFPVRLGGDGMSLVREYLKTHRKMRKAMNIMDSLKDRELPLVVNYALLTKLYRYQHGAFSSYRSWFNLFSTFINQFNALAEVSMRQHYVFLHVPKTLPSVRQLMMAAVELNQAAVKVLREPAGFMLLEFWKWLAPHEGSEPSLFAGIPKDKIHLLNFVFVEGGKWCVINFGTLTSFRTPTLKKPADPEAGFQGKQEEPEFVIQAKQHVSGEQLAKRVLRMYMSIMESRNAALKQLLAEQALPTDKETQQQLEPDAPVTEETLQVQQQAAQQEQSSLPDMPAPARPLQKTKVPSIIKHAPIPANYLPNVSILDEEELASLSDEHFQHLIREQDAEIEKDLQMLEELSQKQVQEHTHPAWRELAEEKPVPAAEAGVVAMCEKLASSGSISAAEYRKHLKAAQTYKEIKAPVGDGKLDEFMVIAPEVLKLGDGAGQMHADAKTVIDKTMLKSSLNDFTSRYVKEVLHKDIANTVMSVQNAGVAVTGYRVERTDDILGGFETHVIKLAPVIGQPSTMRLKVPIVKEDGSFVANNVTYKLRKLYGDVPIRKTAPNVVALTSYYGKCFITRGRRNSDNYGYWLQNAVLAKCMDKDNSHLTDVIPNSVFDQSVVAPRSYTAISGTIAAVTLLGRYRLRFDMNTAMKEDGITAYPRAYPTYLGKDMQDGSLLFLDSRGNVHHQTKEGYEDLGSLEQFMGIGKESAPVEYTTARVFGKDIPVGVILGLEMGMEKLLAALRVQPRIVPAGERAALTADEWALRFSDETWVFKRSSYMASLVLGGFLEYEKSLKSFSAHSFDKRGVYVNLLEVNGIGVRFVRELDLMNTMFVDSISRDILVEMKQPTTFLGLLFVANQMLKIDAHPDELDPAYMRIKGYERVSGAIYAELIHSLRQHNSSLSKANLSVQMNPYAVWKRISEDPAKLQVSEINPLASLQADEAVTYLGEGGRGRLSMTKNTRGYHRNSMGTISEATVDSSDVSINIHTSADPQFTSLRGMSKRFDMENPNPTALLSTSALLAPASDRDD